MKRLWTFFAALAVCTIFAGLDEGDTHDAAALVPVQALVIDAKDGTVFVTADTGDWPGRKSRCGAFRSAERVRGGAFYADGGACDRDEPGVVPCAAGLCEPAASSGGEIIPGDGEG
ncbi:MAG: hypothetical protein V8T00_06395 [Oscillospiraceae bacterium]